MAAGCCEGKEDDLAALRQSQAGVLKIVLLINAVMFGVELTSGILSRSTALIADSLDMFGDASTYALTLYVLNRSERWKAGASLFKGIVIILFGAGVLFEAAQKWSSDIVPAPETMGVIGAMALIANLLCLKLLTRHRTDDLNMRSVWICSRNDIIANTGVLIAAGLVASTGSKYPDIIVGLLIGGLFLRSAFPIIRESLSALKTRSA